jgi:hypothetical protein
MVVASIVLGGCGSPRSESEPVQNPFASAERVDASESAWSGRVLERLNAGSYVYLRVARDGAAPAWVVTAEAIAPDAENVRVRALRRVNHFESKRLGRAFAPLFFGIVRKDQS